MISRWLIHFFLKFVWLWNYFFIVSSCFKWVFLTVFLGLSSCDSDGESVECRHLKKQQKNMTKINFLFLTK